MSREDHPEVRPEYNPSPRSPLLDNPTVEGWEAELEDILAGERDSILRRLGSVAAYTKTMILSSRDQPKARESMKIALRRIVHEWQPVGDESDYSVVCLLDLIGAYLPSEGFVKIIGFMQHGFRFPVIPFDAGGFGSGTNLHMKALVNLEYYYPSAHPKWKDDPGFESYVQVLRQHLEDERYSGYALSRLIKLNVIRTQDQIVMESIKHDNRILEELIELTLSPLRLPQIEDDLRYIYTHCFILGFEAKEVFEQVLKEHEAFVENDRMQLKVTIPEVAHPIRLTVPEDLMVTVLEEVGELGYQRALEVEKENDEDDE